MNNEATDYATLDEHSVIWPSVHTFEEVQKKYQDLGAWDTEPRTQFAIDVVRVAILGKPYPSEMKWSLYWGGTNNCHQANMDLHAAALKVYDTIKEAMPDYELLRSIEGWFGFSVNELH